MRSYHIGLLTSLICIFPAAAFIAPITWRSLLAQRKVLQISAVEDPDSGGPDQRQLNRKLADARKLHHVTRIMKDHLEDFDSLNLITALHRVAKRADGKSLANLLRTDLRRGRKTVERLAHRLMEELPSQIKSLPDVNLANIIWALGRLEAPASSSEWRPLYSLVAEEICTSSRLPSMSNQQLSNLLWGFAKGGVRDKCVYDALIHELTSRARSSSSSAGLTEQDYGMAFDAMGLQPDVLSQHACVGELCERVAGEASRLSGWALSNVLWGITKMEKCAVSDKAAELLVGRLVAVLNEDSGGLSPQGAVKALWALVTLKMHGRLGECPSWPAMLSGMCSFIVSHAQKFPMQSLALAAWSLAKCNVRRRDVFDALGSVSARRIQQAKPQDISNLCWSFASVGVPHRGLLAAAMRECAAPERLGAFSEQHVCNTVWGLATLLPMRPDLLYPQPANTSTSSTNDETPALLPSFLAALAHEIDHRRGRLGPMDAAVISWAMAAIDAAPMLPDSFVDDLRKAFLQEEAMAADGASPLVLGPLDVTNLLWGFAKSGQLTEDLLQQVIERGTSAPSGDDDAEPTGSDDSPLSPFGFPWPAFTPQHLANLAYAAMDLLTSAAAAQGADGVIYMSDQDAPTPSFGIPTDASLPSRQLADAVKTEVIRRLEGRSDGTCDGDQWGDDWLALYSLASSFALMGVIDERLFRMIRAKVESLSGLLLRKDGISSEGERDDERSETDSGELNGREAAALGKEAPLVLHETEDVMVLYKPPRWSCAPPSSADRPPSVPYRPRNDLSPHEMLASNTVEDIADLVHKARPAEGRSDAACPQSDSRVSLGFVHRLDVDTSGPVLVAKRYAAYHRLKLLLESRRMTKLYLCLCHGSLPDRPFACRRRLMVTGRTTIVSPAGRPALTFCWPVERYAAAGRNLTLAVVAIATGRQHQIRVHLSTLGFPLVGDAMYGDAESDAALEALLSSRCPRQFLHACFLAFDDTCVACPLSADLQSYLTAVRECLVTQDGDGGVEVGLSKVEETLGGAWSLRQLVDGRLEGSSQGQQ
ncbi:unnamed protein product [Vitrella brassicaformis CCMP3155]|uniref:Pseudouridine synthase RsuA/RluA-like domain-containing protein n=2 Tax=Vitrella brassicaformis TaxID=1169539 RepID=A0A0G4FW72_VITBC|nr:unnamed protein product [Vitrella brassicaformis CCMP3155]|eukprot:CEM18906.1 unnamed protein product [Vitrella brassicaformis CCMP3155]